MTGECFHHMLKKCHTRNTCSVNHKPKPQQKALRILRHLRRIWSVFWHHWLGCRNGIQPVKTLVSLTSKSSYSEKVMKINESIRLTQAHWKTAVKMKRTGNTLLYSCYNQEANTTVVCTSSACLLMLLWCSLHCWLGTRKCIHVIKILIQQPIQEGQHPLTGQRAPPISGGT